jgi:putative zinc finger/helix-turn-helix YgiT family protein
MKCPNCKHVMKHDTADRYHYIESGLDNLILEGIDIFGCPCGENIVRIPAVDELHKLVGLRIIIKNTPLTGNEIRFLRKNMGMSATKLAGLMGIDNATVSRWENEKQKISKSHDHFLRLIYCNMKRINPKQIVDIIQNEFPSIQNSHMDIPPYVIPQKEWAAL